MWRSENRHILRDFHSERLHCRACHCRRWHSLLAIFSRPLDYGDLVRISICLKIRGFLVACEPCFSDCHLAGERVWAPTTTAATRRLWPELRRHLRLAALGDIGPRDVPLLPSPWTAAHWEERLVWPEHDLPLELPRHLGGDPEGRGRAAADRRHFTVVARPVRRRGQRPDSAEKPMRKKRSCSPSNSAWAIPSCARGPRRCLRGRSSLRMKGGNHCEFFSVVSLNRQY